MSIISLLSVTRKTH